MARLSISQSCNFIFGFIAGVIFGLLIFSTAGCVVRRPPIRPPEPDPVYRIEFGNGLSKPKLYKDGKEVDTIFLVIGERQITDQPPPKDTR